MFSCELKFVIDLLKKWLGEKCFRRYRELDFFTNQKFKTENPIDWSKTKYVICDFRLPMGTSNFPSEKITTYLDFVISTEHVFIRNIFDCEEFKSSRSIQTLEKYHEICCKLLKNAANYSKESDIEDISDDCIVEFVEEINFDSFTDLYLEIENTEI